MKTVYIVFTIALLFSIISCGSQAKPEPKPKLSQKTKIQPKVKPLFDPALSGLYKGNLPCSDCPVIQTVLRLSKDGVYLLIENYQKDGQNFSIKNTGRWVLDGRTVRLLHKDGAVYMSFLVKEDDSLSVLDPEDLEIAASEGFLLKKAE